MNKSDKIFIAGARGLVGSAIVRRLEALGYDNLLTPGRQELDLLNQQSVADWFAENRPDYVFLAAAKVGGILANNTYPGDFIYQNLSIQNHVIHSSFKQDVQRLIFLGSSCIYPKFCDQPMKEDYLMTGELEPTNSPYAVAKIAGIEMCWSYNRQYNTRFLPVMPTNLYGPNDNFDLNSSHVLPALIRKFHEAKISQADTVIVWGTGSPKREFLHVDDLAGAVVYLAERKFEDRFFSDKPLLNIGTGLDITIGNLAELIKDIVGFDGQIEYDSTKPDGTPRKLLDTSRIKQLGWKPEYSLKDGIAHAYQFYLDNQ